MLRRISKIALGVVAILTLTLGGTLVVLSRGDLPHYPPGKIDLKVEVTPERVERGSWCSFRSRPST